MNFGEKFEFDVVVEAHQERRNATFAWHDRLIRVQSRWYAGTDQEKYEVLARVRQIYDPCERANIRGDRRWSPNRIARSEGFTAFRYRRVAPAPPGQECCAVTIVE